MNSTDFKGKSALNIPGKAFLIVIVIMFSSISFTLGFLAGKNAREDSPEPVAQTPMPLPNQAGQLLPQQPAMPDNAAQSQETRQIVDQRPVEEPGLIRSGDPDKEVAKEIRETTSKEELQERDEMYTVQLGAVKNKSEAENLKAKYEKKGYKVYMTTSNSNKHEKIHKIRIGKFSERKEAEILALKLKKNDGLNTFVTFTD